MPEHSYRAFGKTGLNPRPKCVVVVGADGAARAIATELALASAADVLVVNRSVARPMRAVELRDARPGMLVCDVVFNPPKEWLLCAARDRGIAGRRLNDARLVSCH